MSRVESREKNQSKGCKHIESQKKAKQFPRKEKLAELPSYLRSLKNKYDKYNNARFDPT